MSTATATLSYVYGITRAGNVPATAGVDDRPITGIERGGLVALTSAVPRADFDADPLKSHLENLVWLERTARAHHTVIATAADQGEVVPFRLCTLFADEERVAEMLEREHERLAETLERLSGCAEWGIKVIADPSATEASNDTPAEAPETASEAPGHAFFARKRQQAEARRKAVASTEQALADTEAVLRQHARASVRLRPQQRSLSGHSGEMVSNTAYLVERSKTEAFTKAASERAQALAHSGLTLDVTGPFAPYNFTGDPRD